MGKKSGSIASTHWCPASMLTHPAHTLLLLPPLPFSPPPHPLFPSRLHRLSPSPPTPLFLPHPFPPSSLLTSHPLPIVPSPPFLFSRQERVLVVFVGGSTAGQWPVSDSWRSSCIETRAMPCRRGVPALSRRVCSCFLFRCTKQLLYCGGFSSRDPRHLEW